MGASTARADDRLDLVFAALSDRTRRAMLARLAAGPAMVTELAQPFAMSLPAVSKHLKVLERARLVSRAIDGRVHHCTLDPVALSDADRWFDSYRQFWSGTLESLARYAETGARKSQPRRGRRWKTRNP